MSQGTFSHTLVRLEAFNRIFVFRPKIDFFPRVRPRFLAKNGRILKSAFSLVYVLRDLGMW